MRYSDLSVKRFMAELSGDQPYPGGGSAACLVAVAGVSLSLMVGRIVLKKKSTPEDVRKQLRASLARLSKIYQLSIRSIDGDIAAYKKVVMAYSIPKEKAGRAEKIQKALVGGYEFQKKFAAALFDAKKEHQFLTETAKGSIASDLVLSRHFLKAAFLGAVQTARVNLEYMKESDYKARETEALAEIERGFLELVEK